MNNKLYKLMNWPEIEEIIYSDGDNPHRILGAHKVGSSYLVQCFFPDAKAVSICTEEDSVEYEMDLADDAGFFAALIPFKDKVRYHFAVTDKEGTVKNVNDAYVFEPLINREDCIKFNSGIYYHIYRILGAHPMDRDGIKGTNFATWAPDAARVSVIGDFNHGDGRIHQMRRIDPTGIFEIFIPDIAEGTEYQYEIKTKGGMLYKKADPYSFADKDGTGEISVVSSTSSIQWTDKEWIDKRRKADVSDKPLSITETSFDVIAAECIASGKKPCYKEFASVLLKYVRKCGFDTIELMPVMEHPDEHQYEIRGFYSVKSKYGSPQDFMGFINEMHNAGIRVIFDFAGTFFTRSTCGLDSYDGKFLYEYSDPRKGEQVGRERLIFDYGRKQVTNFLLANAVFWLEEFHADGLRLTDIAKMLYLDYDRKAGEWVPNIYGGNENLEAAEFIKQLNQTARNIDPGIYMITKETACYPHLTTPIEEGGLGFDFKWNNGWSHDYISYIQNDPLFRSGHHNEITFSMIYCYTEKFVLAFSHEDVGGYDALYKLMPGDDEQKAAGVRLSFAYLMVHPGKKMFYHGTEAIAHKHSEQISGLMHDLNAMYHERKALYELDDEQDGFEWINCMAADQCILSFVRKGFDAKDTLLVIVNMAGVSREMQTGVVADGKYTEILNTDSVKYGGSGYVNPKMIEAARSEYDGRDYSINFRIAPLSVAVFAYEPYSEQEKAIRKIKEEEQLRKEKEKSEKAKALESKRALEEAKMLENIRKKYEKELKEQQKAIEEKYVRIEEEKIFSIASEADISVETKNNKAKGSAADNSTKSLEKGSAADNSTKSLEKGSAADNNTKSLTKGKAACKKKPVKSRTSAKK